MIRLRCIVLGALVCSGAVGVASADPFDSARSPDLAALAAACAPVTGKPSPSLPLLMDVGATRWYSATCKSRSGQSFQAARQVRNVLGRLASVSSRLLGSRIPSQEDCEGYAQQE